MAGCCRSHTRWTWAVSRHMRSLLAIAFVAVFLSLFMIPSEVQGIRFYLNGGEKRCFTQDLGPERRMRGDVRVTDGKGEASINVRIRSPKKHIIYQKTAMEHGKFSWKTDPLPESVYEDDFDYTGVDEEGPYEICVENYARGSHERRMVFMEMAEDYGYRERKAKKKHVDRVQESLVQMSDLLNGMISEMAALESRERRLVKMTERTSKRLTIFASFSFAVIIGAAIYQLRYYKHYFKTKRLI